MNRTILGFAVASAICSAAAAQSAPPPGVPILVKGVRREGAIQNGNVNDFRPEVAAVDSGGQCVAAVGPIVGKGQRGYHYTFGAPSPHRNITVIVDTVNNLVRYSDLRGDLRAPFSLSPSEVASMGPVTGVTVDAARGSGVLRNSQGGETTAILGVQLDELLDAEHLGVPRRMIEHVLRVCGQN